MSQIGSVNVNRKSSFTQRCQQLGVGVLALTAKVLPGVYGARVPSKQQFECAVTAKKVVSLACPSKEGSGLFIDAQSLLSPFQNDVVNYDRSNVNFDQTVYANQQNCLIDPKSNQTEWNNNNCGDLSPADKVCVNAGGSLNQTGSDWTVFTHLSSLGQATNMVFSTPNETLFNVTKASGLVVSTPDAYIFESQSSDSNLLDSTKLWAIYTLGQLFKPDTGQALEVPYKYDTSQNAFVTNGETSSCSDEPMETVDVSIQSGVSSSGTDSPTPQPSLSPTENSGDDEGSSGDGDNSGGDGDNSGGDGTGSTPSPTVDPTQSPSSQNNTSNSSTSKDSDKAETIAAVSGGVVGGVALLGVVATIAAYFRGQTNKNGMENDDDAEFDVQVVENDDNA